MSKTYNSKHSYDTAYKEERDANKETCKKMGSPNPYDGMSKAQRKEFYEEFQFSHPEEFNKQWREMTDKYVNHSKLLHGLKNKIKSYNFHVIQMVLEERALAKESPTA